ncbi:hypothetical protein EBI_26735, partial [Enterocytozoon bieneusi H348]
LLTKSHLCLNNNNFPQKKIYNKISLSSKYSKFILPHIKFSPILNTQKNRLNYSIY